MIVADAGFRSGRVTSVSVCVVYLIWAWGVALQAADEAHAVRILLRPSAEVPCGVVRLKDVAELRGGTAAERQLVGEIDLIELTEPSPRAIVYQQQVRLRLELADLRMPWILSGPLALWIETTSRPKLVATSAPRSASTIEPVSHDQPVDLDKMSQTPSIPPPQDASLEDQVLTKVVTELARITGLSEDDFLVQLAQPLPVGLSHAQAHDSTQLIPHIGSATPLGRRRIDLREMRRSRLVAVHPITIDLQRRMQVPIVQSALEAYAELTSEHVRWEDRYVTDIDAVLTPKEVSGCVALRTLYPGQVLHRRDIRRGTSRPTPDVQARALVRVVAQRGRLTVTLANGEALQAGKIGDSIRVRNPQSGRILTGQIVGPNEVRLAL